MVKGWTIIYQLECIELAKPGREHVTTIDGEIQTWLPDANFSNNQIWICRGKRRICRLSTEGTSSRNIWQARAHSMREDTIGDACIFTAVVSSRQQRTSHPLVHLLEFAVKSAWTHSMENRSTCTSPLQWSSNLS